MWAGGGAYPLERWHRLLNHYCPEITQLEAINPETSQFKGYLFLASLLKQEIATRYQITALVKDTLNEVLFDILQYEHQLKDEQPNHQLSFTYDNKDYPKTVFTLARIDQTLTETTQQWQLWQQKQLTPYSPNLVPIIQKPKRLRQNLENSKDEYRMLTKFVDGKRTLRSLALELRQPLPNLTLSVVRYVNSGIMSFVEVQQPQKNESGTDAEDTREKSRKIQLLFTGNLEPSQFPEDYTPLVMCIDDSPTVCTQMKQIITSEGCRFLEIQDPITAIPNLLKIQPDLIFLDLVMPVVNGYELCAQIRRISKAQNIPIVILTGKDGLIDRVRTKIVGANDFISKPVIQERVSSVLRKYALIKP
ncbi:MAG: response regulator [Xenococcaceae cyanobacterium MO_234.B1]|nr:response regulator [Xenococcaceae cyanobacterium MO_234.B1]